MIIVTGAAGFIGSCLVSRLNEEGFKDIVVVDDFSNDQKNKTLEGKIFSQQVHRDEFIHWLRENHKLTQCVFHIGARTDTTEFDVKIFDRLNRNYTKDVRLPKPGEPLVQWREGHLTGLLEYLNPARDCQVLRMAYRVTA